MALTVEDDSVELPPRLLVYGPPGFGKSSLACEFPYPYVLDVEKGLPRGCRPARKAISSFADVMDTMTSLYDDEHPYRTVVVDSLDRLEPMVWDYTCKMNKWANIETPGYGKGYIAADENWRAMLDLLYALSRDRGMASILICHSEVSRFDSPTSAPFNRYDLRLQKRAAAIVQDEMDAILFLNQEMSIAEDTVGFNQKVKHAEGSGQRLIFTEPRPAWTAKNRLGMPDKIRFMKGKGFDALAQYLPQYWL